MPDLTSRVLRRIGTGRSSRPTNPNTTNLRNHWDKFTEELIRFFGNPSEKDTAERKITELRMRDDGKIGAYVTRFKQYASTIGWNDAALRAQFHKGFASRLKDKMANRERLPSNLADLQAAALTLDFNYWRREEERRRERNNFRPSTSGTERTSTSFSRGRNDIFRKPNRTFIGVQSSASPSADFRNKIRSFPPKSGNSNYQRSHSQSSSRGSTPRPSNDLSNKLSSDGTLKGSVRQQRIDNKLCLYCGSSSHLLDNCTLKPKSIPARGQSYIKA